jgi:predicted metal-dependent hydrolase
MQMSLPLVESLRGPLPASLPGPETETIPQDAPRYFVRHRRARRYILRVDPDGRVRVTIPRGGSRRDAEAFADRNSNWVDGQLSRLRSSPPTDDNKAMRARARQELPPLLLGWAARLGLEVSSVEVRNQRTRWGSCGRGGRICLNWRLLLMPEWVRDYVLVHELMHLRRMDHSPRYWALVGAAYPAYREARTWLRANGAGLR